MRGSSVVAPVSGRELDPEQAAQLEAAFAAILPRADSIADDITDRLAELESPWYDPGHPERYAELRASTRAHIRQGIELMAGHERINGRAVDLWNETGRRRAQQGIPMSVVLSAYSYGTRALWEQVVAVGEELDVPDVVLLHAGQVLWLGLDVQNQVVREAYRREELVLERQDPGRVDEVIEGLVQGRGSDPAFAAQARAVLGMVGDEELLCLVWLPDEPVPSVHTVRERMEDSGVLSHWRLHTGHVVGLAHLAPGQAPRAREVVARVTRGRVGTAMSREGVAGVRSAHQAALTAATSMPRGADQVADIVERLPEAVLARSPEITRLLVEETIGPLLQVSGVTRKVLLETLVAVMRNGGSATQAAEELVCHRNTVIYRVKRIEELTGRSLDSPRDRLLLALASLAVRDDPRLLSAG